MLQLSKTITHVPVMSLRIGGQVATAGDPIINPTNLKIEGWYCADNSSNKQLILLSQDVREVLPQGLVVDDFEVLSPAEDLIRLKSLLSTRFQLLGYSVVSDAKRKLGKVSDYATETTTFFIQRLYTTQSLLRSMSGSGTSVDRNQIIEINARHIIVKDPQQLTPIPRQRKIANQEPAMPVTMPATQSQNQQ